MNNKIYDAPKSEIEGELPVEPLKPGLILKALLVIFTFLSCGLTFIGQFIQTGNIASGVGGALAPIIFAGIIIGIFQIGKRFRNTRSRYKIFLWCQILFSLSSLSNILSFVSQNVR